MTANIIKNALLVLSLWAVVPGLNAVELGEQIETIMAQPVDEEYAAYLAEGCTSCHQSEQNKGTPVIEGMGKRHIVISLLLYKNGSRVNAAMTSITSGLGDEEIAALAEYFSQVDSQ
ncbi:MAG: c-type cytochrome [Granulosicoccaceae bacterium]